MSKRFRDFTMSIFVDRRLALIDIICNIAYCAVLFKGGVIDFVTKHALVVYLLKLFVLIKQKRVYWYATYEDIHLNVEYLLSKLSPGLGDFLRTARSRNDLVSTDLRVWLKLKLKQLFRLLKQLIYSFLVLAVVNIDCIVPSFTHFQLAQPILLSHYFLCYCAMLQRDLIRLQHSYYFTDIMPLGCGAVSGTSFVIDRVLLMTSLSFGAVCCNSVDAVSDRDYVLDFCYAISMLMMHVSRFCEEIIVWSNKLFNFVILADLHSSGSSMMPQKKNPDGFELLRARSGLVISNLMAAFLLLKALPLSYNKDYQEDKRIVFEVADIAVLSLDILNDMIKSLRFNVTNMYLASDVDFAVATDLAEYLTRNGMVYKQAHALVSALVSQFYSCNSLKLIPISQLLAFSTNKYLINFITTYTLESVVNAKRSLGGTARINVIREIKRSFVSLLRFKL
ncbi:argininosuccinate lyase [Candidatus Vidania fulgoroideae]|uniref:Argininosuccinate lyase n=1 Tax=Candidatus Vidania fulgoroideorum TaxID=881286 RepID=A0A974X9I7_9PROT|nr:argininosuccinate lyase [Candidatus Vidania fulgoroideae]